MVADNTHLLYLGMFYRSMREAIELQAFADVAYGCYTACMYGLKVHRPFAEIAEHANAFRLSVRLLKSSGTPVDEETFLLECMWEKLLWHMGRQLLFESILAKESLAQVLEFSQPLCLSDYSKHSIWIQDAFSELEVKFQFLRFIVSLDLLGTSSSRELKQSIVTRFLRSWGQSQPLLVHDKALIRKLSRNLWSALLALLFWCAGQSTFESRPYTSDFPWIIISSIHLAVDLIPTDNSGSLSHDLRDVTELGINCLVLIGLVVSESHSIGVFCSTRF
jgi:hypothetical protein